MKDFLKFITRLDNIVLLACLILMGAVVCYGENGPTPQTFVGSNNIADSSVTADKIALLPCATIYCSSNTGISTGSAALNFLVEKYDNTNSFSSGAFTVPVSGYYLVSAHLKIIGSSANAISWLRCSVGGVTKHTIYYGNSSPAVGSRLIYFAKDEVVTFTHYSNSTSAITLAGDDGVNQENSYISIAFISR